MKNMLKQMLGAAACCTICTTLPLLPASAAEVTLGDVNADNAIDATDASEILVYATEVGAGTAQTALDAALADVNGDGTVNALDASDVLVYTSKTGSGYTGTMEQHIRSKKNFEYYHTLSDYEVYAEYCEMYGFEAEEELPSEEELPHYKFYQFNVPELTPNENTENIYLLYCTEEASDELMDNGVKNPELFGFPSDWDLFYTYFYFSEVEIVDGVSYGEHPIKIAFEYLALSDETYTPYMYERSIIDSYRVALTLNHCDFVAQYGCPGRLVMGQWYW